MSNESRIEQLLCCFVQIVGRATMPEERVREIVGSGAKQVKAFNLCDGTKSQIDVAQQCKIQQANLSRTVSRWIQHGVMFWIGEGRDARLLHIYPIPASNNTKSPRSTKRSRK